MDMDKISESVLLQAKYQDVKLTPFTLLIPDERRAYYAAVKLGKTQ